MSEEGVTNEEVQHIASLARIELTDDELERFRPQFADILSYFETLDSVPTVDRERELTNVMRADEVTECLSIEDATDNAADTEDEYFKGPNVS